MRTPVAKALMAALALVFAGSTVQAASPSQSGKPAPDSAVDRAFVEREAQLQRSTASAIFNVELKMAEARRELAEQGCSSRQARRQPCLAKAQGAYGSALDLALGRLQVSQSMASHLEASINTDR